MQTQEYFSKLSNPQLEFAIQDIRHALDLLGKDPVASAKYSDQLGAAVQEKRRREGLDCCPHCKRPL